MKVAVCLPSRGLIHSRTMADLLAVQASMQKIQFSWHIISGYSLPAGHNLAMTEGMKADPDYLWLVEEDQQIPVGLLPELLTLCMGADMATADYPIDPHGKHVNQVRGGYQLGGTGCLLMKPDTWRKYGSFTSDYHYTLPEMTRMKSRPGITYGHQDIDFYVRVQRGGGTVAVASQTAGHYRLYEPGKLHNNNGAHQVETWRF